MTGLCWIRRDLRLHDHAALSACAKAHSKFYVVFVFDEATLGPLRSKSTADKRLHFIAQSLLEIHLALKAAGGGLIIRCGDPTQEIPKLAKELGVQSLYFNRDYTPYSIQRDASVTFQLEEMGCQVQSFKDHVIFEPHEILNNQTQPFRVFTAYWKVWRQRLDSVGIPLHLVESLAGCGADLNATSVDSVTQILNQIGFVEAPSFLPGGFTEGQTQLSRFASKISVYDAARDYPSRDGTSMLSVYLRFGCISIREAVLAALSASGPGSEKWLAELVWREFYQMIFFHFPEVKTEAFQEKYRSLKFETNEDYLRAFKAGQTGFPIIDAAMRCLNQTGWMHNRLRMVTASFLTKILLVDWKRGERYFAWKLLDYELPSNNGGWQWAAGIGCDAAPYFRIFNPTAQSEKFDAEGDFIRLYVPELRELSNLQIHCPATAKQLPSSFRLGIDYPYPIVDYASQRQRAIEKFRHV